MRSAAAQAGFSQTGAADARIGEAFARGFTSSLKETVKQVGESHKEGIRAMTTLAAAYMGMPSGGMLGGGSSPATAEGASVPDISPSADAGTAVTPGSAKVSVPGAVASPVAFDPRNPRQFEAYLDSLARPDATIATPSPRRDTIGPAPEAGRTGPRQSAPNFITQPEPGIEPSFGLDDLIPIEKVASGLGKLGTGIARRLGLTKKVAPAVPYRLPASTPVGRRTPMQSAVDQAPHNPQMKVPKGKPLNAPEVVGGREFTGHALDRMAGRGLVPSVIENAIKTGTPVVDEVAGTIRYYDPVNKVGVIVNKATGRVITVE